MWVLVIVHGGVAGFDVGYAKNGFWWLLMFVVDGDGESFFVVVSCSGGGGLSFDGCGLDFQCWWWQLFLGNFGGDKLGFVTRF